MPLPGLVLAPVVLFENWAELAEGNQATLALGRITARREDLVTPDLSAASARRPAARRRAGQPASDISA